MKLFMPCIGDSITLIAPWSFNVYYEGNSDSLIMNLDPAFSKDWRNYSSRLIDPTNRSLGYKHLPLTLEPGQRLTVDKIYIKPKLFTLFNRNHFLEQDSITFKAEIDGKKVRFCASLSEVNKIVFDEKNVELFKNKKPKLTHKILLNTFSELYNEDDPQKVVDATPALKFLNPSTIKEVEDMLAELKKRQTSSSYNSTTWNSFLYNFMYRAYAKTSNKRTALHATHIYKGRMSNDTDAEVIFTCNKEDTEILSLTCKFTPTP